MDPPEAMLWLEAWKDLNGKADNPKTTKIRRKK
jgi:hypothetical protein